MEQSFIKQKGALIGRSFFILLAFTIVINFPNTFSHKKAKGIHWVWPAEIVSHLALGFRLQTADLFWIRFIQDMGFKESSENNHLGWAYQMANLVTELDPKYRIVYVTAGTVLSVEVDDQEGATRLLEKGVKNLPTDWVIYYRLGYHYLFEVQDCKKAAENLNQAALHGAPYWLSSLALRIYTASAQYDIAEKVLEENLARFKGTYIEETLLKRKADLTKQKQKSIANPKKTLVLKAPSLKVPSPPAFYKLNFVKKFPHRP